MHILLVAIGSHGDVHPFVGIGIALRQRGHHVAVLANEMFGPMIEKAGLCFISVGSAEEYAAVAKTADLWHPMKGFKLVMEFGVLRGLQPVYDAIAEFYRNGPPGQTVVAASSLGIGARAAQEKLGIPLATVHLSPTVFQSAYEAPVMKGMFMPKWFPPAMKRMMYKLGEVLVIDPVVTKPVNKWRAEMGLPPAGTLFRSYMHSPQRVIALFPDWFAAPQPDWPPNTTVTGFPLYDERDQADLSPQLLKFLDEGTPPIAFTPGSAMWQGGSFFAASAAACKLLGRRGILLTRHPDHIPADLPEGVIHIDFAPFSRLLPRCAALVHHGGVGTLSQALAAGVPQLIMPMAHDQPDNAARLVRLGVARSVPPRKYRPERVAAELRTLLDDDAIQLSCRAVAARFQNIDPIGRICDLIESLARAGPPIQIPQSKIQNELSPAEVVRDPS